jgi:hypothetical protein
MPAAATSEALIAMMRFIVVPFVWMRCTAIASRAPETVLRGT